MSPFLEAVRSFLPEEYTSQLDALPLPTSTFIDTLLRFALGGDCPTDASSATRQTWSHQQASALAALQQLKSPSSKRPREDQDSAEDPPEAKKTKLTTRSSPESKDDDPPLYTLHSISVTSPLRKKVNITLHKLSIRFINPTTDATEACIPLSKLKRAFLLPTRGKSKPHWTALLLSSDTPQIVFGVDATPTNLTTTDHSSASGSDATKHPKGTSIIDHLHAFLARLPFPTLEPSASVFRSAMSSPNVEGGGVAGVDGHRSAKPGTLWFFSEGLLWDGKPCEFWALSDLVGGSRKGKGKAIDVDLGGAEGVWTVSATGRTCSVVLRRKVPKQEKEKSSSGDEDMDSEAEEEEEQYADTDIGQVDGKEQEGIARWVKKHRHLFGVPLVIEGGKPVVVNPEEDDSDEDDSDFVGDSSSDGGSASNSGSESDDEGWGGDPTAASDGSGSDDDDDENTKELDPARHPLLRPGAMPKISRAAIDAVVGMVEEDLMGPAKASGSGSRRDPMQVDESDEDEEDELDD